MGRWCKIMNRTTTVLALALIGLGFLHGADLAKPKLLAIQKNLTSAVDKCNTPAAYQESLRYELSNFGV